MARLLYANTKNPDMFYAVRVSVPDPFFYAEKEGRAYIFLDQREYAVFCEKNTNPALEPVLLNPILNDVKKDSLAVPSEYALALHVIRMYGLDKDALEVPSDFPLGMADFLRQAGVRLECKESFYPERAIKKPKEIEAIRQAVRKTENAFLFIKEVLKNSTIEGGVVVYQGDVLTSEFLKRMVDMMFLQSDLISEEGIIISSGPQSAIPHHPGEGPILPHQPIVCDIFPRERSTKYFADITRTFVKGEPSEELRRMYEAVRKAQEEGIKTIKPGVSGADVHALCCRILIEEGYEAWLPGHQKSSEAARNGEKGFTHGTGHGIGLEVHEDPRITLSSMQKLVPGNVVTVEPGLYYPGFGGVRIEDDVFVTDEGGENLVSYPKDDWIIP